MSFSVVVLCPNGRRETIKINSNNSVLQVLEEACLKQKLNPEEFDLYHYKKCLDISLPIRFANLPNNAVLELQPAKIPRKDCLVTIALQLESGERHVGDFKPTSTLFDVLKQCLPPDLLIKENNEEQTCIYMRQKISGDAIKTTTLRSLGLTKGSAIIRLIYRKQDQFENQAHISSPLASKISSEPTSVACSEKTHFSESSVKHSVHASSLAISQPSQCNVDSRDEKSDGNISLNEDEKLTNKVTSLTDNEGSNRKGSQDMEQNNVSSCNFSSKLISDKDSTIKENKTESMEIESDLNIENDNENIGDINYIGDRYAVLYSLDDITAVRKADLPDEFFDLTVKDVRYLMEEFKRERIQMENQPLLTKDQRDRQLCQKFSGYNETVIRVYFPERLVLQAVFRITETVQTVCDFLRNYLEDSDLSFYLYTTPPKEKLITSKTLLECLLVPAAVVHFGSDSQRPYYLNTDLQLKKSDPRAAALAASQSRLKNVHNMQFEATVPSTSTSIKLESSLENVSTLNDSRHSNAVPEKSKPVPKWLKLSKK